MASLASQQLHPRQIDSPLLVRSLSNILAEMYLANFSFETPDEVPADIKIDANNVAQHYAPSISLGLARRFSPEYFRTDGSGGTYVLQRMIMGQVHTHIGIPNAALILGQPSQRCNASTAESIDAYRLYVETPSVNTKEHFDLVRVGEEAIFRDAAFNQLDTHQIITADDMESVVRASAGTEAKVVKIPYERSFFIVKTFSPVLKTIPCSVWR